MLERKEHFITQASLLERQLWLLGDSESCKSSELSQNRSKFGWSMDSMPSKLHALSKINNYQASESFMSSQTTRTCSYKRMLFDNIQNIKANVPKKEILQRIKSKNEDSSYQLEQQLSLKWSTGIGLRIGCVADYPPKLREQALTFVDLPVVICTSHLLMNFQVDSFL